MIWEPSFFVDQQSRFLNKDAACGVVGFDDAKRGDSGCAFDAAQFAARFERAAGRGVR